MSREIHKFRNCFRPQQWFNPPGGVDTQEEGFLMWVYRENQEGLWEVGYFMPDRTWFAESSYINRDEAAARVHWLNGGNG